MYQCHTGFAPAAIAPLREREIHVWHGSLQPSPAEVAGLAQLLSPDELERADRFHFEKNRSEFIFARGTLRTLLGSYLGVAPADLRFAYSPHGKPSLDDRKTVDFNISHTEGMVVFAFARSRRIGVDVEKVRRDFDVEEIAERFFSVAERLALREIPEPQRYPAFFHCWTRKEAYIKARGEGLSHPLHQFDVSLAPGKPAALLGTRPDAEEAKRWSLWDLAISPEHAAALAAEENPATAAAGD
ncbi:MAG: 4'-phosphopantetheinyl transferase superfamily protein [Acidobacteriia bacterium]|nr:4'-phosphopantetheinyl transferase superfamily protein [Terriglobia bacterium]